MSDFLFARPSFLEGFARNMDFFGALQQYNTSKTPEEADANALSNDIKALRADMRVAKSKVLAKNGKKD